MNATSQALSLIAAIAVLLTGVLVGILAWRSKAVELWKSVAEGYQEKLEQRDDQLADMKSAHAAETAELRAQIDELRRQVEQLRARDQTAVLELIRAHETTAAERHTKTLDVLVEIRDTLKERSSG